MVSYSAATTDNSVGRVGHSALDRVFTSDNRLDRKKKSLQEITYLSKTYNLYNITTEILYSMGYTV